MSTNRLEWVIVKDFAQREIGAIGFVGGKAAVITTFYDHRDGNKDGSVSGFEKLGAYLSPFDLESRAVVEVAMAAATNTEVIRRDTSFGQTANNLFLGFARDMVKEAVYKVYFSQCVGSLAKSVAGAMTKNLVKQFVIRKGMEKAVKEIYDAQIR
jgi:hypothetical protein